VALGGIAGRIRISPSTLTLCRLRGDVAAVAFCMKMLLAIGMMSLIVSSALGSKPVDQQADERTVFVTGSLIPQRIKLKSVGTTTVSPVRIIDRREINQAGRRTAAGILIVDPSVRIVGH
jgi:hypothetical protein